MIQTVVYECLLNAGGTADNDYSPRDVRAYIPGFFYLKSSGAKRVSKTLCSIIWKVPRTHLLYEKRSARRSKESWDAETKPILEVKEKKK